MLVLCSKVSVPCPRKQRIFFHPSGRHDQTVLWGPGTKRFLSNLSAWLCMLHAMVLQAASYNVPGLHYVVLCGCMLSCLASLCFAAGWLLTRFLFCLFVYLCFLYFIVYLLC